MTASKQSLMLMIVLCSAATTLFAQSLSKEPKPQATGSITGRVVLGGKAAAGTVVQLLSAERDFYDPQRKPAAKATTDAEGGFRLSNVPAGRYNVMAVAPAHVPPNESEPWRAGKFVTIDEGETIENVDIRLVRGGVITGRVTDADDQPVMGEHVTLTRVDKQGQQQPFYSNRGPAEIDDRGVYRVYGLPPGRYTVSVGEAKGKGTMKWGEGRGYYARTFYPNETDEAKATVIEVTPGSEAKDIDIKLGRASRTFQASGRIISSDSNQPVPNHMIGVSAVQGEGQQAAHVISGFPTDAKGEFHIPHLMPGRYHVFADSRGESDSYSEPVTFEIADRDVAGLEVELRRGLSLSGVVVVEGADNASIASKLEHLRLAVSLELEVPSHGSTKVAADGSFRFGGLRPGKARVYLAFPRLKNFTLTRIERDGAEQQGVIEMAPGKDVTGVRVHIAYATGVVRGQVKFEGGTLPEGAMLHVGARGTGDSGGDGNMHAGSEVDARGRFIIEGLPSGTYELTLNVRSNTPTSTLPP
ncbi:MAG: carboxypeptidase regulatory-like domain-containing protein, partial [Pyrinomonadaceae bacterium]|nr:carboxypeptidase regulatory-like domain-containing protein [Pyrinomonadaceae bacterium]